MSKKVSKKNEKKRTGGNDKKVKFKVPEDVKKFAEATLKKFKKKNDFYDSKKDLKKGYYDYLLEMLPDAIKFVIRYGHFENNKELKEAIYEKICDPSFIKFLKKQLKDDAVLESVELLPNVIYNICREATIHAADESVKKDGTEDVKPDVNETFDLSDLTEISKIILKKKIKKLVKAGVDESVAFDVLSVIPSKKIIEKSPYFHIKNLFAVLYQHAKAKKDIKFNVIIKKLFSEDELRYIVSFAMLEKRGKCSNFNDGQKQLFSDITMWSLKYLEGCDKKDLASILTAYVKVRKTDDSKNNDEKRRFYISEVPQDKYPKVTKVVAKIIQADESAKKYL